MPLSAPFGLFRFGLGPDAQRAPLRPGLRARSLAKGDYTRDETGALEAGTYTQQRVLIALTTPRGSMPSAPEIGSDVPNLERDDGRLELAVLRDTERALRGLVREGAIRIDRVEASVDDGVLTRVVHWTDLATGESFPRSA